MNEKMKLKIERELFPQSLTRDDEGGITHFDKYKFAELIVQECAGIYEAIDNGNKVEGTENYLEALHKRFGVKG
jgi:hypothetical protein